MKNFLFQLLQKTTTKKRNPTISAVTIIHTRFYSQIREYPSTQILTAALIFLFSLYFTNFLLYVTSVLLNNTYVSHLLYVNHVLLNVTYICLCLYYPYLTEYCPCRSTMSYRILPIYVYAYITRISLNIAHVGQPMSYRILPIYVYAYITRISLNIAYVGQPCRTEYYLYMSMLILPVSH